VADRIGIRVLLLVYGAVVAAVAVSYYAINVPRLVGVLEGTRVNGIGTTLSMFDRGGPPLAGVSANGFYPIGWDDDRGPYTYIPLLGHVIGAQTPRDAVVFFVVALVGLLAFAYPLIFYGLFDSIPVALLAPWAVFLPQFDFLRQNDVYSVTGWVFALCLPLLMLIYKRWGRFSLLALAGVVAIGSVGSSLRSATGIPILVAAFAVVFWRVRPWVHRGAVVAVLLVVYFAMNTVVLHGQLGARNRALGEAVVSSEAFDKERQAPSGHGLWHNVYIGLGYLPNPYGLRWLDDVGVRDVRRVNPEALRGSKAYESTARHLYFEAVRAHPGFAWRVYRAKLELVTVKAIDLYLPMLFLVPLMVFTGRNRRFMRRSLLLTVPAIAIGLASPLAGVPDSQFSVGLFAGLAVVWILSLAWAVTWIVERSGALKSMAAGATARWRTRFRHRYREVRQNLPRGYLGNEAPSHRKRTSSSRSLVAPALLAGAIVLAGTLELPGKAGVVAAGAHRRQWAPLVSSRWVRQPVTRTWRFDRGLATSWSNLAQSTTRTGRGLLVVTTSPRYAYQLLSAPMLLAPGRYGVIIKGEVQHGGLALGILDTKGQAFVRTNLYYDGQFPMTDGLMVRTFTLAKPTKIQLALTNWSPGNTSSRWFLESASLTKTRPECGCSPRQDDAWITPALRQVDK
jgi:hypothetical protein